VKSLEKRLGIVVQILKLPTNEFGENRGHNGRKVLRSLADYTLINYNSKIIYQSLIFF
jgi:hypothetical protein